MPMNSASVYIATIAIVRQIKIHQYWSFRLIQLIYYILTIQNPTLVAEIVWFSEYI